MPVRTQRFIAVRVFIGVLFVLIAALQIRFTAVTTEVIADSASFPAIPELGITTLEYDSPGKASIAAGVKKGDVLLAVDQEPVHSRADEARIFLRHKPGDAVILTLQRAKSSPLTASMWLSTFFREPVGVRSS